MRQEINFVRNPYSTRKDDEDVFEATRRNYAQRWDRVAQLGSELKVAHIEARLQWGGDTLREANNRFTDLQALVWQDIQDRILSMNPNEVGGMAEFAEKQLKRKDREFDYLTVLYRAPKDDKFDRAIMATIDDIEAELVPKLIAAKGTKRR